MTTRVIVSLLQIPRPAPWVSYRHRLPNSGATQAIAGMVVVGTKDEIVQTIAHVHLSDNARLLPKVFQPGPICH